MVKSILRSFILLYQYLISPFLGPSCRFFPTCSEYAKDAFTHYGAFQGAWLVVKRLGRCHPFSKSEGYDPLPIPTAACCHQKDSL